MPYFKENDVPEPYCAGSYTELEWKGDWDNLKRPRQIQCFICGAKLTPEFEEYLVGENKGLFFACVPNHYAGEE